MSLRRSLVVLICSKLRLLCLAEIGAGLKVARAKGKRLGRPPLAEETVRTVLALSQRAGIGARKIAKSTRPPDPRRYPSDPELLNYLRRLEVKGVDYVSYQEQRLDSTGPFKDAMISMFATLAKQERARISERTIAQKMRTSNFLWCVKRFYGVITIVLRNSLTQPFENRQVRGRVHRGKAHAADIPDGYRYRYDGLYRVARYWEERGRDGFKIWRFRIEKLPSSDFKPLS
jgi:SAD/SRA domain/Resolvase, N terminal domain